MIDESKMIAALDKIERTKKNNIYAARKGIVAGVSIGYGHYVFRRVHGIVRFEFWPAENPTEKKIVLYALPPDLEKRAGDMLDNL